MSIASPDNDTRVSVTGTVVTVTPIEEFSKFRKQGIVVSSKVGERERLLHIQAFNDKIDKIGELEVGTEVWASFFPVSKEWQGPNGTRYFTDLRLLDLRAEGGFHSEKAPDYEPMPAPDSPPPPEVKKVADSSKWVADRPVQEAEDDVPF